MNFCVLLFAILGVATAAALPAAKVHSRTARSLPDDLKEFVALLDIDAALEIVVIYLAEDAEVQAAAEYAFSDEFADLLHAFENVPELVAFLKYLDAAGIPVWEWIDVIHHFLGHEHDHDHDHDHDRHHRSLSAGRITGGLAGLWADLLAIFPRAEANALFQKKLESSEEFAALIALLNSDEAQIVYDRLKANEEYQSIRGTLKAAGIDFDAIIDVLKALIGWQ